MLNRFIYGLIHILNNKRANTKKSTQGRTPNIYPANVNVWRSTLIRFFCVRFGFNNILVTQAGNSFTQRSTSTQELMNESSIGTRRFRIIRQIFEGLRKSKYQSGIHGPF